MCRTGCPTKNHESWGACLRAASIQIDGNFEGNESHRAWDKECHDYAALRRQGLQPKGTTRKHINAAVQAADKKFG